MNSDNKNQMVLDYKKNSFNFLRLALAMSVIVAHSFELGGFGYDPVYHFSGNIFSIGAIGVDGFFCISGVLITASYKNINSLGLFLWHRVLRIFPGYWACIILTAVLLPVIFGVNFDINYPLHNSLMPAASIAQSAIGFFVPLIIGWGPNLANIAHKIPVFGQQGILEIFSDQVVNGSLWSLSQEFRLYCLIAILGVTGLLKKPTLIVLFLGSWATYSYLLLKNPSWEGLANASSFRTSAHFLMGAILYLYVPTLKHSWALVAIIVATVALWAGYYPIVSPVTTAYLMLYLATALPLSNFGAKNDFSYGLYIYAYPIQKTLTALSLNSFGILIYFLLSSLFTLAFAIASWYTVERYALKLKKWKLKIPLHVSRNAGGIVHK